MRNQTSLNQSLDRLIVLADYRKRITPGSFLRCVRLHIKNKQTCLSMTTKKQHEMKYCGCGVTSAPIWTFFTFICGNAHRQREVFEPMRDIRKFSKGGGDVCLGRVSSISEKHGEWQLTSFLRSLLSLCRCHLMTACGERA